MCVTYVLSKISLYIYKEYIHNTNKHIYTLLLMILAYLIERALLAMQIGETSATYCMTTTERYRTPYGCVKVMTADWT